jgi:excisionase family DNA binding protein
MIDRPALEAALSRAEAPELLALAGELQGRAWASLTTRTSEHQEPADDRLLTMPEVAERLGVTEHQAREMGRRQELPVITVGDRFVRVRARALEEWIRLRENGRTIRREGGR